MLRRPADRAADAGADRSSSCASPTATPDEVLGVLLPDKRAATIWNVAVNGVMAGCRPEYMPVLVALVEAMCDPVYGVEHSGNTPGGDTLIILNGPIIKELGFNYTQGALRDGFRPNTSIGRFWRLYLRNVAGFLPAQNRQGDVRQHLARGAGRKRRRAEDESAGAHSASTWVSAAGDNTSPSRATPAAAHCHRSRAARPKKCCPILPILCVKFNNWQITFTTSHGMGTLRPLAIITPIIAETIARAGWSKADVKNFCSSTRACLRASSSGNYATGTSAESGISKTSDCRAHPARFYESDDPNRRVPIVWKAEDFMIAVGGDPLRNNAYVFAHNGFLGYPVGKKIRSPRKTGTANSALRG